VSLRHCDALVYKGCERRLEKALEGVVASAVFMHYVDADGPYAEWKLKETVLGLGLRN